MKVYIVCIIDYSDSDILGVYSTIEMAELAVNKLKGWAHDNASIEEVEIDKPFSLYPNI